MRLNFSEYNILGGERQPSLGRRRCFLACLAGPELFHAMGFATIDGQDTLIAAYTCGPIVLIPTSDGSSFRAAAQRLSSSQKSWASSVESRESICRSTVEASTHCPPGAVIFKTEPIPLALREPLRALPETGPLGVGMVLWIACADADALHKLIVERGGAILSPLADGPFGRFFVAGDPDGYTITFHTARS